MNWAEVEKGTPCKITGSRGVFNFQYFRNGEVTLYGGVQAKSEWVDACYRTVLPSQVSIMKGKR
jgi:hypothetical protein